MVDFFVFARGFVCVALANRKAAAACGRRLKGALPTRQRGRRLASFAACARPDPALPSKFGIRLGSCLSADVTVDPGKAEVPASIVSTRPWATRLRHSVLGSPPA